MKRFNLFLIIFVTLILSGCGKKADFLKTNTVTFHDLTLEMPEVFDFDSDTSDDEMIFYSYDDSSNSNLCMLYFAISNYLSDNMKEVVQDGLLGNTDFRYNVKNINGDNWSVGSRDEGAKLKQTFYAINKNGKEYTMSYDDFGSGDDCARALSIIESSLIFK